MTSAQTPSSDTLQADFHAAAPGSVSWRDLEEYRTTVAHKELAIAAALNFCAEWKVVPPEWLVKASAELMAELLNPKAPKRRGRNAGHIAEYRQHLWDLERWDAVLEIRRIRDKMKREADFIQKHFSKKAKENDPRAKNVQRLLKWLKHGTFECAAMYLTGRDARAGIHAIRESYRRIERKDRTPPTGRYCVFDDTFLRKIGLEGSHDRKPGTKWLPLYNLKP